jgi:hypothetical protein
VENPEPGPNTVPRIERSRATSAAPRNRAVHVSQRLAHSFGCQQQTAIRFVTDEQVGQQPVGSLECARDSAQALEMLLKVDDFV